MSNLKINVDDSNRQQCWLAEAPCVPAKQKFSGILLAIAGALLAHLILVAVAVNQPGQKEIRLASTTPPASVRVNMVAPTPAERATPIIHTPSIPQVITAEKATRTVAQPAIKPVEKVKQTPKPEKITPPKAAAKAAEPKPVVQLTKPEPTPQPVSPSTEAVTADQKQLMNLPAAGAKDVQSVGCRVPAPDYPRQARRQKLQGTVLISMQISRQGQVQSAVVVRSSGNDELDEAARRTVMEASCTPYMESGRAIAVRAVQPVTFRLTR